MVRPALEVIEGGKGAGRAFLKELYSKYGGAVYGRCQYLLRDATAAEDAMQDVFARALSSENSFRGEASPLTWLLKIATHHCLNVQRANRAPWRHQFADEVKHRGEGTGGPHEAEQRDLVQKALARFDTETQQAVVHYWVDDLTLQEVADLLGRSVPTIRKRLADFASATGREFEP
jgi:RNA polymerase sigma factor (sigma-70 family)